jgi:predicted O-methyltransferase YrrM
MHFFPFLNRLTGRLVRYLEYFFTAGHLRGYGLHSPFMFSFYKRVIARPARKDLSRVRRRHRQLKRDKRLVHCPAEWGAGSMRLKTGGEKLRRIVRHSSVSYKYGRILYNLVREFQPETILELGTSVGVSTMYLAEGRPQAALYTLEGCPDKMAVANENGQVLNHPGIHFLEGEFEQTLTGLLPQTGPLDMVFIDGNHQKAPTLNYFSLLEPYLHDHSIVIVDDIYWSPEMKEAWKRIREHPGVKVSVDLYRMGILFFREELYPQRFKIRY